MTTPGGRLGLRRPDYVIRSWAEIIPSRRSRRTFLPDPIGPDILAQLEHFCRDLPASGRARVVVAPSVEAGLFRGVLGSYGRVSGAPSALIIAGLANPALVEAVGYVGEAAVLEATRLGLDSCWVGGFFKEEYARRHVALRAGERVWAVVPIGYATSSPRASERLMKRAARSNRRLPLRRIVSDGDPQLWPPWSQPALELARYAPSAVNRQPWRFRRTAGGVLVEEDPGCRAYGIPKRLDCGIAMLHFEVGCRVAGVLGEWKHLVGSEVALYRPGGFSALDKDPPGWDGSANYP